MEATVSGVRASIHTTEGVFQSTGVTRIEVHGSELTFYIQAPYLRGQLLSSTLHFGDKAVECPIPDAPALGPRDNVTVVHRIRMGDLVHIPNA